MLGVNEKKNTKRKMKSCKDLKEKIFIFSLLCKAFYAACLGGIQQMRVREWRRWMCSCRSGWTEMEWGEEGAQQGEEGAQQGEEGAQQGEEVGRLGAMHVPLLSQSGPNWRRCAREAAATSPPGPDGCWCFAASRPAPAPACRTRFAGAAGTGGPAVSCCCCCHGVLLEGAARLPQLPRARWSRGQGLLPEKLRDIVLIYFMAVLHLLNVKND